MIKAIIIDDEPKARLLLKTILHDYCKDVEVLADCEDLPTGIKAIKKHQPHLVFLDIEMPGHSGLELLDYFNDDEINFSIIFTTAYNEYAIKAFKLSAIDYLLKPLEHNIIIEAVEKYKSRFHHQNNALHLKQFQQNISAKPNADKRIIVPASQNIFFLKPEEVIMIKAESSYSEIHLIDRSKIIASKNLKHFEEVLADNEHFIRCHKSYIINKQHIKQYSRGDGGSVVLENGLHASISSEKFDELIAKISF